MTQTDLALNDLYLADETAWLETMAELIESGNRADLDYANLREYLTDTANRDRRAVESRLVLLLMHILKWEFQQDHRSSSWERSIIVHRNDLNRHAERGVLRNHAEAMLGEIYAEAVELASVETGLSDTAFPKECPYTLDEVLAFETK